MAQRLPLKVQLAAEVARLREERDALAIALVTKPHYAGRHGPWISVKHYRPDRHDGGAVIVTLRGSDAFPLAMAGIHFDEFASGEAQRATLLQNYEEADFWTRMRHEIRNNQRVALGLTE